MIQNEEEEQEEQRRQMALDLGVGGSHPQAMSVTERKRNERIMKAEMGRLMMKKGASGVRTSWFGME